MTKRKKLVKKALKHPEDFSYGELAFFQRWLDEHKRAKSLLKRSSKDLKNSESSGASEADVRKPEP